jgi:alcohol dehydrogenase YqhD (iron-dependent ADH family)
MKDNEYKTLSEQYQKIYENSMSGSDDAILYKKRIAQVINFLENIDVDKELAEYGISDPSKLHFVNLIMKLWNEESHDEERY